jgi:hypothetical protein
MLGNDAAYAACLERAHQAYLAAGNTRRAVRCAFWIGHNRLFRGDPVRASGWFARAHRMLGDQDCVEAGYLLIPAWLMEMDRGTSSGGYVTAMRAEEVAERFGDLDLAWLARDDQARALLSLGRVEEGLRLVDEALIAATSGELFADRHRHRVLQHARVLPGRLRGRPCAGVDARADAMV